MTDSSLVDRVVLVTGASRGIGREMALALLEAGARVAVLASRDSPQLQQTLRMAGERNASHRVIPVIADVREQQACEGAVARVCEAFGALHVLVNNAAIPAAGEGDRFWEIDPDHWRRTIGTNVDGVFWMSRAAAPVMIAQGFGKIINISTSERTMVRERGAPYGPSKAFMDALSRVAAQDLAGAGVSVNVLAPGGAIDTLADVTGAATPGRSFQPISVMRGPILWLASDLSNGHSGERFVARLWDETLPIDQRVATARQSG